MKYIKLVRPDYTSFYDEKFKWPVKVGEIPPQGMIKKIVSMFPDPRAITCLCGKPHENTEPCPNQKIK